MGALAILYDEMGRRPLAAEILQELIDIRTRTIGAEHRDTIASIHTLSVVYFHMGQFAKGEPLAQKALAVFERDFGADYVSTLSVKMSLGLIYMNSGQAARAANVFAEVLDGYQRTLDERDPRIGVATFNLALAHDAMRRFEEAETFYVRALKLLRQTLDNDHPLTLNVLNYLSGLYKQTGQTQKSKDLHRQVMEFEIQRAHRTTTNSSMLNETAWHLLTCGHSDLQDPASALIFARRACEIEEANSGDSLWACLDTLALAQLRNGDVTQAYEAQKRSIALVPAGHPRLDQHGQQVISALLADGERTSAIALVRSRFDRRIEVVADHETTAKRINNLAWDLMNDALEEVHDPVRALDLARRACSLEEAKGGGKLWTYLDTLALAQHLTGDTAAAIATQKLRDVAYAFGCSQPRGNGGASRRVRSRAEQRRELAASDLCAGDPATVSRHVANAHRMPQTVQHMAGYLSAGGVAVRSRQGAAVASAARAASTVVSSIHPACSRPAPHPPRNSGTGSSSRCSPASCAARRDVRQAL